jgi:hypothetical protein
MSVGVIAGTLTHRRTMEMAKQTKKQAVEQRTQQRLAARSEAAQRGVQTRRRNREAQEQPPAAAQAPEAQEPQAPVADRQTKRPERNVAQDKQASGAMVTVALRGESAQRLRALAAAQQMSLSKLLVRMMEVFEAQAK